MLLSDILIWSGPITYIGCWIIAIFLWLYYELSEHQKNMLIAYAIMPTGSIFRMCCGYVLGIIGL
jgi:hypothetical protein